MYARGDYLMERKIVVSIAELFLMLSKSMTSEGRRTKK